MINFRLNYFRETTDRQIAEGLLRIAILYQQTHRQSLSRTYPPASRPGEYPAARTFNLRDSITYEPTTLTELMQTPSVKLGMLENAWYGARLELRMRRLGLERTFERIRNQIELLLQARLT